MPEENEMLPGSSCFSAIVQRQRGYDNLSDTEQHSKLSVIKARHGLLLNLERLGGEKRWASGNVPEKHEATCFSSPLPSLPPSLSINEKFLSQHSESERHRIHVTGSFRGG